MLTNKILLITGASDGIGKSITRLAAAEGATVILHGKSLPKLEHLYDEITNAGHPEPLIYPLDLEKATPQNFQEMHDAIEKEFGQLDGLINNAGWVGVSCPVDQYDIKLWHQVMQVNLNATFMLTRACLGLLHKAPKASIIFTTDNKHTAYWGAYGVAKAGALAFMQILADELENTSVRVNAIDPGPVRTTLRTRAYPGEDPNVNKTPGSVAPYYIRLLSEESSTVHGRILQLDEMDSTTVD